MSKSNIVSKPLDSVTARDGNVLERFQLAFKRTDGKKYSLAQAEKIANQLKDALNGKYRNAIFNMSLVLSNEETIFFNSIHTDIPNINLNDLDNIHSGVVDYSHDIFRNRRKLTITDIIVQVSH